MKAVISLTGKNPFWKRDQLHLTYQSPDHVFPNWESVDPGLKKLIELDCQHGYLELTLTPVRESIKTTEVLPKTLSENLQPDRLRVSEILPMIENCTDISVLKKILSKELDTRKRVKILEALNNRILKLG